MWTTVSARFFFLSIFHFLVFPYHLPSSFFSILSALFLYHYLYLDFLISTKLYIKFIPPRWSLFRGRTLFYPIRFTINAERESVSLHPVTSAYSESRKVRDARWKGGVAKNTRRIARRGFDGLLEGRRGGWPFLLAPHFLPLRRSTTTYSTHPPNAYDPQLGVGASTRDSRSNPRVDPLFDPVPLRSTVTQQTTRV